LSGLGPITAALRLRLGNSIFVKRGTENLGKTLLQLTVPFLDMRPVQPAAFLFSCLDIHTITIVGPRTHKVLASDGTSATIIKS
jgi:hypothetical protein